MIIRIQLRKTLIAVAAALFMLPCHISAQSTLSQNQDGFNGETMDGFMNVDPDKDSTVIERTVSQDYYQFVINTSMGREKISDDISEINGTGLSRSLRISVP